MADKGPNYDVERKRLELQKMEHRQTTAKQRQRLEEIVDQKSMNLARAELANMELDDEAEKLNANIASLTLRMAEIDKNLGLMTTEKGG